MQLRKPFIFTFLVSVAFNIAFTEKKAEDNVIIIPKGQSQSYILTNKNSTFFSGETGTLPRSSFQGMNVQTNEFLEDYIIEVNGNILKRENAEVHLFPNKVVRVYDDINLKEEIALMDSLPVLMIKLQSSQKLSLSLVPHISGGSRSKNYITYWADEDRLLYIAKKDHLNRSKKEDYPVWTGVYTFPHGDFSSDDINLQKSYVGLVKNDIFLPGKINFILNGTAYIFFIVGDDKKEILFMRKKILKKFNIYFEKSGEKINGVRST